MNRDLFIQEIHRIFRIAFIQKVVLTILRAAWVGGAVYLGCWGTNRLWGWFPDERSWSLIAIIISLSLFSTVFLERKPSRKFVWRLDRGFGLKEQVYTLYELALRGSNAVESQPVVDELVESEYVARLPAVRRNLVDKGWRVKKEFEATLVVLILLMVVYLTSVSSITSLPPGAFVALPPLGTDPSIEQVFPRGIPGDLGNGEITIEGIAIAQNEPGSMALSFSSMEWIQIKSLMRELGSRLSQEAGTYELGQALTDDNYIQAANQFSKLAESVIELTPEIQFRIAGMFLDTAVNLQNIQQYAVATYFQEASAGLFEGVPSIIAEEMDDLSELMRLFSQFQEEEFSVEADIAPLNQSLDQFRENTFEVGEVDDLPEYVSSPGDNDREGELIPGGSEDFIMPYHNSVIEGVLLPYQYSMEDFDVVSSYFSPR